MAEPNQPNTDLTHGQQSQASNLPNNPSSNPSVATTALSGTVAAAHSTMVGEKRKNPSKKSDVWEHFVKLPIEETNGELRAACNYCGASYACDPNKHGTNSLKKHLQRCKKHPNRALEKKQSMLAYLEPGGASQTRNLVPHTYNFDECRRALAEYVISDEIPFRSVEKRGFRKLCNQLEPRFPLPSRMTVARDCYKLYLEESKKIKECLKKSCVRVCLTTDTWTSVQNLNYMCLTAHFIDENWQLQKRILNFCPIENHRGDTIGKAIEKCLLGWGIGKVFTLTVDNASSNDTAVAYLKKRLKNWNGLVCGGEFLHMRCCAHILNLVVNDGLKDLNDSILAIRNAVRYVRSSPSRMQRFKSFVEKEKIESNSIVCLDVATRWNSTYLMLDSACKFQKVFERMEDEDEGFIGHFREDVRRVGPPNASDWSNATIFVKFLKVFYDITLRMSGSLYVTSNACFHDIADVQTLLLSSSVHQDHVIREMAMNMKAKYDKYWGRSENLNPLLVLGTVLDPRYKLDYVNITFDAIYQDPDVCEAMKKKVSDAVHYFFDQYSVGVVQEPIDTPSDSGTSDVMDPTMGIGHHQHRWKALKKTKITSDYKTELEKFLEAEVVDDEAGFDILAWWKENATKYKVLSLVARDVLAVPVSTVASESAFSTGGRVLDVFRSSLSPTMTEALICAQNWLNPQVFSFNDREFDQFEESDNIVSDVSGSSSATRNA